LGEKFKKNKKIKKTWVNFYFYFLKFFWGKVWDLGAKFKKEIFFMGGD
jgi:hypothetical protein